jgi:hypothetical protein
MSQTQRVVLVSIQDSHQKSCSLAIQVPQDSVVEVNTCRAQKDGEESDVLQLPSKPFPCEVEKGLKKSRLVATEILV